MLKNRKLTLSFLAGLCIILFLTFMTFTFKEDEEVSMGFMEHNLFNIININELDVHPPLYYLLLKSFLLIFTFWTKSIFVKVIFARVFSLFIFILTLIYLEKIVNLLGIHLNYKIQLLLYITIPSILEVATYLRMYELVTLFIVLEYYNLKKFDKEKNKRYLCFSIIFLTLASYTHYFAIIIASLLFFVHNIYYINYGFKKVLNICSFYLLFCILYLPIIPYLLKQFFNRSSYPSGNAGLFNQALSSLVQLDATGSVLKELFDLIYFIFIVILTLAIIHQLNNRISYALVEIGTTIFLCLVVDFTVSILYFPFFESRFIFPLVSMYFFLLLSSLLFLIKNNNFNCKKIIISCCVCLFSFIFIGDAQKIHQNILEYDYPSIQLIHNFKSWKSNKKNVICMNKNHYPTQFQETLYATQNSVYLHSIDKNAVVYHSKDTNIYRECNGNKIFVRKLFNNLHCK